jgi:hypothetical protein
MNIIFLLLSLLIINPDFPSAGSLQLTLVSETELTDSEGWIYQTHFSRYEHHDGQFYLTVMNPPLISGYDLESGNQVSFENIEGDGPHEIDEILSMDITDDHLYVMNRMGRIVGIPLHDSDPFELNTQITMSKDLVKANDRFVIANDSHNESHYLTSADPETGDTHSFGPEQRIENILLQPFTDGGVLLKQDESLFVITPHGQDIYRFSADDLEEKGVITLDLPDFESSTASHEMQAYFDDPELMISFTGENSIITQMIPLQSDYLIEVLHAHDDYSRELYILNDQFELQCRKVLPDDLNGMESPKIHASDGEYLYFYREEIHHDEDDDVKKAIAVYRAEC